MLSFSFEAAVSSPFAGDVVTLLGLKSLFTDRFFYISKSSFHILIWIWNLFTIGPRCTVASLSPGIWAVKVFRNFLLTILVSYFLKGNANLILTTIKL